VKNLFKLNKYLIKYKWHFTLGFLFVAASNYFGVLIPQQIRKALDFVADTVTEIKPSAGDNAVPENLNEALMYFAFLVVGFMILKGIFMYAMRQTIIVMSRLIEYDLRNDIFNHLTNLDLAFYKRNKTGDVMSRISEDVNKVRMYLGPSILYGINLLTLFVMTITAMFKVNPTLALYTLIPLPILSASIYIVSNIINKRSSLIQRQLAALNSTAQEVYSGIRVVKSYVKEDQFYDFFKAQNKDYMEKSLNLAKVNAFFFPLMILLISASTLLTIYVGGLQVAKGAATPGNIAEFVIYVNMLTWPVTSIGWIASLIQQAEASQERINQLLDQKPSILNTSENKSRLIGKIEFDNVSFTYKDSGIKALKNISFNLKPGEKMAIIGKTGSGKSTVADLMLRLFDPTSGTIKIDGVPISEHNLYNLRKQIGYIPQDVFLFSETVANNISFGSPDAQLDEVILNADYASVKDDILSLPKGFETRIGERGITLSGGQKQRVSMARAFIKNPEIIIMDDALSAVDTNTEQKIINYLDGVLKHKTSIIITHRIYNLLDFDKIIILEDGEITEMGTHDELLQKGGTYFELFEQQRLTDVA
jgi:ATP-binding cassette subfamily B protein